MGTLHLLARRARVWVWAWARGGHSGLPHGSFFTVTLGSCSVSFLISMVTSAGPSCVVTAAGVGVTSVVVSGAAVLVVVVSGAAVLVVSGGGVVNLAHRSSSIRSSHISLSMSSTASPIDWVVVSVVVVAAASDS